jgi:phosphatidate phosphatase APP1
MEFFELNDIPVAPLFLRDWGVRDSELLPTRHGAHKWTVIERLIKFYDRLPFILIGDNGQEDPEIYLRVARTFHGRVPAVYIRDVARKRERREQVSEMTGAFADAGSELVLTGNTMTMAGHALGSGWVSPAGLNNVAAVQETL